MIPRYAVFLLLALLALGTAACDRSEPVVTGDDVAVVNGRHISFRELEAQRIIMFVGGQPDAPVSEPLLIRQYEDALRQLLVQELVCAYVEGKRFALPEGAVEREEERIRADYPSGTFEEMLLERDIAPDLWRDMVRRRLVTEHFVNRELRAGVTIPAEEVRAYYNTRSGEFLVPEQWHYVQISGLDKKDVERAAAAFMASGDAVAVQKDFAVSLRDIRMGKDRLPEDVLRELSPLAPGAASSAARQDEGYRAFVLLEKRSATEMSPEEIYKRVEQVLAEEKLRGIFAAWIEKRLGRADVRVASSLLPAVRGNGTRTSR